MQEHGHRTRRWALSTSAEIPLCSIDANASRTVSKDTAWTEDVKNNAYRACVVRLAYPLAVLRRYYARWYEHRRIASHIKPLRRIRRRALLHLLHRFMTTWKRFAARRRAKRCAGRTHALCAQRLCVTYLTKWTRYTQRLRIRERAWRSLSVLRVATVSHLIQQCWWRWRHFRVHAQKQRAEVERFVARRHSLQQARVIEKWAGRRRRRTTLRALQRMQRVALRSIAKMSLRRWAAFTIHRAIAARLEQFNLRLVAARWLAKWTRRGRALVSLQPLRTVCDRMRRLEVFGRWREWLFRIVRSYQLEQRHLVCRLQSYFVRWLVSYRMKALSYTHAQRRLAGREHPPPAARALDKNH